jgi:O-methyltransferase
MKKLLTSFGWLKRAQQGVQNAIQFPVECDAGDREILEHVLSSGLTMVSHERLFTTLMACKHVCNSAVEGDFVECGVWRGGNSLLAADVFRRAQQPRRTWLFDTFTGMTAPTDDDVKYNGNSAHATFLKKQRSDHNAWCYASLEDVQDSFRRRDLEQHANFVKGDVLLTLADQPSLPQRISVLRLDTDWYESTRMELEVLYPRLVRGGVLIVDDYGYWQGAKKAVDEYFQTVPRPFLQYTDQTGRVGVKIH